MSMLRLAVVTLAVTFLNSNVSAQHGACDSSCPTTCNQGCGPRCGFGLGFGLGCGLGCGDSNGRCLSADELWAGFETSQNCQGCVKQNRLNLRGFGFPSARFNEMAHNQGAVQQSHSSRHPRIRRSRPGSASRLLGWAPESALRLA